MTARLGSASALWGLRQVQLQFQLCRRALLSFYYSMYCTTTAVAFKGVASGVWGVDTQECRGVSVCGDWGWFHNPTLVSQTTLNQEDRCCERVACRGCCCWLLGVLRAPSSPARPDAPLAGRRPFATVGRSASSRPHAPAHGHGGYNAPCVGYNAPGVGVPSPLPSGAPCLESAVCRVACG